MNPRSTPVGSIEEMMKSPTTSYGLPPPEPPPPPNRDLLGNIEDYHNFCDPASIRSDWFGKRPNLVGFGISENYDTALHIAATGNNCRNVEKFVKNLVSHLTIKQLELHKKNHNTAVCKVAANGSVKIVKTMVIKKMALLDIPPDIPRRQVIMQVYTSCFNKISSDFWTLLSCGWLLQKCVEVDLFDFALTTMTPWPELTKSGIVLLDTAEMGNTEFLVELIRHYLKLLWKKNDDGQTIFHAAVTHCHESVYNVLREIGSMKDMTTPLMEEEGNNMLHLVGKIAKDRLQEVLGVL